MIKNETYKIYFSNHAPMVHSFGEILNGDVKDLLFSGTVGSIKAICKSTELKSMDGKVIFEGDEVEIYNWGYNSANELLGTSVIIWDIDHGCWQTEDSIIEDQYDFYTKANGRSFKVIGNIND